MRMQTTIGLCGIACTLWLLAASAGAAENAAKPPKSKAATQEGAAQEGSFSKLLLLPEADPDNGPAPLKVQFKGEVYEGSDAVKPKYTWDFGDDSAKVHAQNPTHVYKKPGTYQVTLTVTDAAGRRATDDLSIVVEEPAEQ